MANWRLKDKYYFEAEVNKAKRKIKNIFARQQAIIMLLIGKRVTVVLDWRFMGNMSNQKQVTGKLMALDHRLEDILIQRNDKSEPERYSFVNIKRLYVKTDKKGGSQ